MEDDFLQNIENDYGNDRAQLIDDGLQRVYDRLEEYNSNWLELEDGFPYKLHQHGRFQFVKQVETMSETPELEYYRIAVAKNGGPVAIILRERTVFMRKKDDPAKIRNKIYIFSSNGKYLGLIDL